MFNGDIGVIEAIDPVEQEVSIRFDRVLPARLRNLGFLRVQEAANGRTADF